MVNGEMKNFHAKGYDQLSMSIQAKLTAIVVNLKRIANKILSSLMGQNSDPRFFIYHIIEKSMKIDDNTS